MLKKIIMTALYIALIAALVFGGITRTRAVTGSSDTNENGSTDVADGGIVETTSSDWMTQEGSVQSWQDSILTVLADTGALILIDGRGGRYLVEKAFSANAGERVTLIGYYEGEVFKVATITNKTTGVSVRLRGEDGRPVWGFGGGGG